MKITLAIPRPKVKMLDKQWKEASTNIKYWSCLIPSLDNKEAFPCSRIQWKQISVLNIDLIYNICRHSVDKVYTCSAHLASSSLQSLESTPPQGRKVSPALFGIHIFATGFSNTVSNNEMKPSSITSIRTENIISFSD